MPLDGLKLLISPKYAFSSSETRTCNLTKPAVWHRAGPRTGGLTGPSPGLGTLRTPEWKEETRLQARKSLKELSTSV